jgi:hypothetical protein
MKAALENRFVIGGRDEADVGGGELTDRGPASPSRRLIAKNAAVFEWGRMWPLDYGEAYFGANVPTGATGIFGVCLTPLIDSQLMRVLLLTRLFDVILSVSKPSPPLSVEPNTPKT